MTNGPSVKTSVLLHRIPPTLTQALLKEKLEDVKIRKVELEPGCSIHVLNEAEASSVSNFVTSSFNYETKVVSTALPSLLLQNLPDKVSIEALNKSFSDFNPVAVNLSGGNTFQVHVSDANNALKAAALIEGVNINKNQLKTSTAKLPSGQYAIKVFNIPASEIDSEVEKAILSALSKDDSLDVSHLAKTPNSDRSIQLRFPSSTSEELLTKIRTALRNLNVNDSKPTTVSEPRPLKRPALFVRNIKHIRGGVAAVEKIFVDHDVDRFQPIGATAREAVTSPDLAVLFFRSEAAALACLQRTKGLVVDGKRINVAFKEVSEPAVELMNIPVGVTVQELAPLLMSDEVCGKIFSAYSASRGVSSSSSSSLDSVASCPPITLRADPTRDGGQQIAILTLSSPYEAKLVQSAARRVKFPGTGNGKVLTRVVDLDDIGVDAVFQSTIEESSLREALVTAGIEPLAVNFNTNSSAFISFETSAQALSAQQSFIDGSVKVGSNSDGDSNSNSSSTKGKAESSIRGSISVMPGCVVQVVGLSPDRPVSELVDAINNGTMSSIVRADRSALVKFRRHKEVILGMRQLRKVPLWEGEEGSNGLPHTVRRYSPLQKAGGESEYDEEFDEEESPESVFDKFTVRAVLKDYMHTDPATRYQIAMNAFERALNDAGNSKEAWIITGEDSSDSIKQEVEALLNKRSKLLNTGRGKAVAGKAPPKSVELIDQQLFRLFVQREDMVKFSHDFREIEAYLGPAEQSDPFNWSQFRVEIGEDVARMQEEIKRVEDERINKLVADMNSRGGQSMVATDKNLADIHNADSNEQVEGASVSGGVVIKSENEEGEEVKISLEDPSILRDKDGHIWSGVILDTDMVQKTMPGNRVNTHRALVCVGNLKGAAGYGMGKGKTGADAVNAAFRAALRNLTHIDLYDNFGLAHDLHGKHNACHAYIRATPRAREMVAGPYATEVLIRFGISSASIKMVGRRDPYAQVMAIFNAIEQHENIDEYAKDRGQRYLTLKWAKTHNL